MIIDGYTRNLGFVVEAKVEIEAEPFAYPGEEGDQRKKKKVLPSAGLFKTKTKTTETTIYLALPMPDCILSKIISESNSGSATSFSSFINPEMSIREDDVMGLFSSLSSFKTSL